MARSLRRRARLGLLFLLAVPIAANAQPDSGSTEVPRTPWGHPDLQGIWDYRTLTPLERPSELAGEQEVWTDEEAAALEQSAEQRRSNRFSYTFEAAGLQLTADRRTSLIVDPPDGRIPRLTPEAQERSAAMLAAWLRPPHGPADRNLVERCIVGETNGAPLIPVVPYNHNVQLFQTPGYVVLLNEMNHDVRVIPLDGPPHLSPTLRQWMGNSRGRWEGETLVVDTTDFYDQTSFSQRQGSTRDMHLVERFRRVDADTLLYEFTVDDPATWTRSWTAAIPMTRSEEPIYEYAYHEGNYGMLNILTGARAADDAAAQAATQGAR